ncbi:hypothetical protein GCM10023069_35580 [Shinella granuli]
MADDRAPAELEVGNGRLRLYGPQFHTLMAQLLEDAAIESGGAKVGHGSGGIMLLRAE